MKGFLFVFGVLIAGASVSHSLPTGATDVPILRPADQTPGDDVLVLEENNSDAVIVEGTTEGGEGVTADDLLDDLSPEDCFLPKSRGPCRAIIDRYFFNTATKQCETFGWSGCGGNKNRFSEKESCEKLCARPLTPAPSSSSPPTEMEAVTNEAANQTTSTTPKAMQSSTTQPTSPSRKYKLPSCPKFNGCADKCVIIQDRSDMGCKKCLCGQGQSPAMESMKDGRGNEIVSSGSNVTVSKTSEVSIGSVSGVPKDAEEDGPSGTDGSPAENCKLPKKRGHCRGMMTRYHYDPALKDCVVFHYGGCEGNFNRFVTKDKCLEYCKGQ